jgi:hypothetical protein
MSSYAESQPLPHETPETYEPCDRESEEDRVARWRLEQFRALGFEPTEALRLTVSEADLHEARALVAAGCSLRLALKILL